MPARRQRPGSSVHSRGRYNCQSSGHDAVSVAAWTLTATWQFARFPRAPQYWRATPAEAWPHLGNDTSSITHTCGVIVSDSLRAIRRRTGNGSHGDWFTNCCRACMFPSGSRSAIGWIDLRRPSSIRPRR